MKGPEGLEAYGCLGSTKGIAMELRVSPPTARYRGGQAPVSLVSMMRAKDGTTKERDAMDMREAESTHAISRLLSKFV